MIKPLLTKAIAFQLIIKASQYYRLLTSLFSSNLGELSISVLCSRGSDTNVYSFLVESLAKTLVHTKISTKVVMLPDPTIWVNFLDPPTPLKYPKKNPLKAKNQKARKAKNSYKMKFIWLYDQLPKNFLDPSQTPKVFWKCPKRLIIIPQKHK